MSRRAVTLFELLLVLTLLVLLGALAWPTIEGTFIVSRLRSAADQIRAAWSDAQLESMRSGTPHLFRYEPDARKYSVSPWDWNLTADESARDRADDTDAATANAATEGELPDGIVFSSSEVSADARAAAYASRTGDQEQSEQGESAPIVFYPDGTSTDASVLLKDTKGFLIRVTLRGLTGISRCSETLTAREVADEGR